MSSPEREGPTTDPKESHEPAESGAPAAAKSESLERTLVEDDPPSGMGRPEGDGPRPQDFDEDADTTVASLPDDDADTEVRDSSAAAPTDSGDTTVIDDKKPEPTTLDIHVRYYGQTDVGLVREHNEDNFLVADLASGDRGVTDGAVRELELGERGAVFAVCDGMGGAAAGEVASQMAVDTIFEFFTHVDAPRDRDHFARRLVTAVEEAGNRIFSAAKMDRSRRGMGTTATVAGLMDKVLFVGQVGDSRAYILRGDELGLITKDQSLVNQLIEAGQLTDEEAEAFEHSNIILQALGTTEDVTVDLTFLELRRGDRLMLCSDGLSGLVHQDMIKEVLQTTADLAACSRKLIEMANAGGGHDNVTVVCAQFDGEGLAEAAAQDHVVYQQYPLPIDEDEDHESIPPRETSIKEGGRKPGADVKRRDEETVGAVPSARRDEDAEEEPVRPFSWGLILVVLLLAAVAAAVAVAMGGGLGGSAEEQEADRRRTGAGGREGAAAAPEEGGEEGDTPVEVRVVTDVDGELWIDSQGYGPLTAGEDVYVELAPGPHRFEAFSGGSLVTSAIITLRAGVPADVQLTMPTGVTETPEDRQVVEQPEGETTPRRPQKQPPPPEKRPPPTETSPTEMDTEPAGATTPTEPAETPPRTGGEMRTKRPTRMTTPMTSEPELPDNPFE